MVNESVHGGDSHRFVGEDLVPGGERRIGGNRDALSLVALGYEFEEHGGLGLITPGIAQVVEDQQLEAIELCKLCGQT